MIAGGASLAEALLVSEQKPMRVGESRQWRLGRRVALPMAELRSRVPARTVGALASWLLRGYHLSWRRDDAEASRLDEALASGDRIFVVFWHSKYIPLFSLLSGRSACIFASESFRGKVI